MLKCRQCGEEVEEPKIYYESYEMWGYPIKEEYRCCPYCGGPLVDTDISWLWGEWE